MFNTPIYPLISFYVRRRIGKVAEKRYGEVEVVETGSDLGESEAILVSRIDGMDRKLSELLSDEIETHG